MIGLKQWILPTRAQQHQLERASNKLSRENFVFGTQRNNSSIFGTGNFKLSYLAST
jgi:hypothetical protein